MNILIKNINNTTTLKEYNDTYFLNHLSLLYGFRHLISSDYNLYPSTLYIIIIILLFVYYIFLFSKIMHSNHIIASIIVNFYDLCFFRLLTIINLDVIVNYLFVKQHPFITNVFINIFISSILIIIIFIAYMNHYQYIFIYLKYNDNIKYPFDYLSVKDNCVLFIVKFLLALQNNLINNNNNEFIYILLSIIICVLLFISFFWSGYYILIYPSLICNNFLYHKLKVCIQICYCFCFCSIIFNSYNNTELFYIISICAVVFSCLCFCFIRKESLEEMFIDNMEEINQLAWILYIKGKSNAIKDKYIERILFHVSKCNKCTFCIEFKYNVKNQFNNLIENKDTMLFTLYKIFLNTYKHRITNKYNNKFFNNKNIANNINVIFYDLFHLMSFAFYKTNVITYKYITYIYYLDKKYLNRNDSVNNNVHIINKVIFQTALTKIKKNILNNNNNQNENQQSILKELKLYVNLLDKCAKIVNIFQEFIPRDTKTPKQFLSLGYKLHEFKSKEIIKFLIYNKKTNQYNAELLIFLLEEITNEPINKERGIVKNDIILNKDILNNIYNNSQKIIMIYNAKLNQAYIKLTGKDMIHYVNSELSELFPIEIREEGKRQFKQSLNSNNDIKHFKFIIYKNKPTIYQEEDKLFRKDYFALFMINFKLYYENFDNSLQFLINGEYKFNDEELVISQIQKDNTFTKNTFKPKFNYKYEFDYEQRMKNESNENSTDSAIKETILYKFKSNKLSVIQSPIIEHQIKEIIFAITSKTFNLNTLPYNITHKRSQKRKEIKLRKMFAFHGDKHIYLKNFAIESQKLAHVHNLKLPMLAKRKKRDNHKILLSYIFTINTDYYVYKVYSYIKDEKENINAKKKHNNNDKVQIKLASSIKTDTLDIIENKHEINYSEERSEEDFEYNTNIIDSNTFESTSQTVDSISKRDLTSNNMNHNKDKRYKLIQNRFITIVKFTFIFCMVIIIYNIVALIIELKYNDKLITIYDVYTELRAINRLFYNVATSILAVICIGVSPQSTECINYYKQYNIEFNNKYNITYYSFEYSVYENRLKVQNFGELLTKFKQSIFNLHDKEANDLLNKELTHSSLSLNGKELQIIDKNISFINALDLMFNSFTIMLNEDAYVHEPVYVFTLNGYNFTNIYNKHNLTRTQLEYYTCVMNYQKYLLKWVEAQQLFSNHSISMLKLIKLLVVCFLLISFIFHLLLIILLYNFIRNFENIFIMNTNQLMTKFTNEIYLNFYKTKYNNLALLVKIFQKNPNVIIKELQEAYDTFIRETNEFKKAQVVKKDNFTSLILGEKENELKNIFQLQTNTEGKSNNNEVKEYFRLGEYRKISYKFFILIYLILFYFIVTVVVFILIWIKQLDKTIIGFSIITENTISACSGYNIFALCQLMLLTNQTHEEISTVMESDDPRYINYESSRSIKSIISLEEYRKTLGGLIKTTNDFLDLNCDTFYSDLNDSRYEVIDKEHPQYKYRELFPPFCKLFGIHQYKDDLLFYKSVFYEINKFANNINSRKEYKDVVYFLEKSNLFFMCDLQFLLYRPFRTWFNDVVYTDAIQRSIQQEKTLLYLILVISIVSEGLIFGLLYFTVFQKLKFLNHRLGEVANAFNVVKW